MDLDDPRLPDFLDAQIREHGGKVELDAGLWLLFAVPVSDGPANSLARSLLAAVKFAHQSGVSADDQWMLYYVDSASRPEAIHWLEDLGKLVAGEVRPVSPAQTALMRELGASKMPHRLAQRLAEWHAAGEISAGAIHEAAVVRTLLDRLHAMEPLFFAAFHTLLANHLVDMVVLLQQMIPEDVRLKNEIVKAGLSRDPFLQGRQDAAAEIRHLLIRFHVINPLDQQKNTAIANPYAAYLEMVRTGEAVAAPIGGTTVPLPRRSFLGAIRAIRRNLYRGEPFSSFDTQAPWMTEELAYPFRFIKQQLDGRPDLAPMDGLYMLERAVEP
jgi:hypothetical protein